MIIITMPSVGLTEDPSMSGSPFIWQQSKKADLANWGGSP